MSTVQLIDFSLRLYATIAFAASAATAGEMHARGEKPTKIFVAFFLGLVIWPAVFLVALAAGACPWIFASLRRTTKWFLAIVDL